MKQVRHGWRNSFKLKGITAKSGKERIKWQRKDEKILRAFFYQIIFAKIVL